jgi:hypothetical protein
MLPPSPNISNNFVPILDPLFCLGCSPHMPGGYSPRNRLSPRFINKATRAKPIQSGEGSLLQSRSKIHKKHKGNKHQRHLNRPRGTEAPRLRPQEGNDAPTPPSSRPKWSKDFARSPTWIKYPQRRPQEGNDTRRHRRRWR